MQNIKIKFKLVFKYLVDDKIRNTYLAKFQRIAGPDITQAWVDEIYRMSKNKLVIPILDKREGGIGGNSNIKNKQIRFQNNFVYTNYSKKDIIVVDVLNSDDGFEKWKGTELNLIMDSFCNIANQILSPFIEVDENQRTKFIGPICIVTSEIFEE